MESNKAMIVISHSWEFVPKGSSHFYYHINSVKSSNNIQNNYNGKNTTINDILSFKNSLNNNKNINSKNLGNEAGCSTTNLDENRSINESYNPSLKLSFDNYQDNYPVG